VLTWPGKNEQDVSSPPQTQEYLRQGSAQDIYCLQEVPAQYRTEARQYEVRPASSREVRIPAVTRMEERVIVDVPEHDEFTQIPAVYERRKVEVEISPARIENYMIPAVYKDVEREKVVSPAVPVWGEIVCAKNLPREKVIEIQRALKSRGYFNEEADGVVGQSTLAAMQRFQADQNLPQGQISVDAVRALGIGL